MLRVMLLCTGNSCRSQMAEGMARKFGEGVVEPHSSELCILTRLERAVKEVLTA